MNASNTTLFRYLRYPTFDLSIGFSCRIVFVFHDLIGFGTMRPLHRPVFPGSDLEVLQFFCLRRDCTYAVLIDQRRRIWRFLDDDFWMFHMGKIAQPA